MNITELLEAIELEAATHARHYTVVRQALVSTLENIIKDSAGDLATRSQLGNAIAKLNDGSGGLITYLLWKCLQPRIEHEFSKELEILAPKTFDIPKWQVNVSFDVLKQGTDGEASGVDITLNVDLSSRLAANIARLVVSKTLESSDPDKQLWIELDNLSTTTDWLESDISMPVEPSKEPVGNTLYRIISVFIHEITHVHQDYQQRGRKDKDTEYRSYLNRVKKEFAKLIQADNEGKKLSPEEQERLAQLYYASPQEIAAFSNQIALRIAETSGLLKMTDINEIQNLKINSQLISSMISHYVDHKLHKTDIPSRLKTLVINRYMKRVYQALDTIQDHQIEKLQPAATIQKSQRLAKP